VVFDGDVAESQRVLAELAGVKITGAGRLLHRAGIRPVGREPGRAGQNLFDAAQVQAALQARPGRWPNR